MEQSDQLDTWLSYEDLKAAGIVKNRETLRLWQEKYNFPRGRLFGPGSRRWGKHSEIDPWLASRPTDDAQNITLGRKAAAKSGASPKHISKKKKEEENEEAPERG